MTRQLDGELLSRFRNILLESVPNLPEAQAVHA